MSTVDILQLIALFFLAGIVFIQGVMIAQQKSYLRSLAEQIKSTLDGLNRSLKVQADQLDREDQRLQRETGNSNVRHTRDGSTS